MPLSPIPLSVIFADCIESLRPSHLGNQVIHLSLSCSCCHIPTTIHAFIPLFLVPIMNSEENMLPGRNVSERTFTVADCMDTKARFCDRFFHHVTRFVTKISFVTDLVFRDILRNEVRITREEVQRQDEKKLGARVMRDTVEMKRSKGKKSSY